LAENNLYPPEIRLDPISGGLVKKFLFCILNNIDFARPIFRVDQPDITGWIT
jgi:hypothetical protein